MTKYTLLGLILTIIALSLSVWQLHSAKKQTNELSSIKKSMTTRYIDVFPHYVPTVTKLLEKAQISIKIACDLPGYSAFSDRSSWLQYRYFLEQKFNNGLEIKIICYNKNLRKLQNEYQFGQEKTNWNAWKKDNKNKLVDYLKSRKSVETFNSIDFLSFMN